MSFNHLQTTNRPAVRKAKRKWTHKKRRIGRFAFFEAGRVSFWLASFYLLCGLAYRFRTTNFFTRTVPTCSNRTQYKPAFSECSIVSTEPSAGSLAVK